MDRTFHALRILAPSFIEELTCLKNVLYSKQLVHPVEKGLLMEIHSKEKNGWWFENLLKLAGYVLFAIALAMASGLRGLFERNKRKPATLFGFQISTQNEKE